MSLSNHNPWQGERPTELAKARADWQTAAAVTNGAIVAATGVIASIVTGGAAAPAVIGLLAAAQTTTIQVGSSFSSNRADQAWGQLQMGILQMGISGLGAFLGNVTYIADTGKLARAANAITQVLAQNTVSYAGSGFQMNEDGSIAYKAPSKGALYSTLVSTGFGAAGAGIGGGFSNTSLGKGIVSTTFNALGSGFQFNDDGSAGAYDWGKAGISFAANMASTVASTYVATEMYNDGLAQFGGKATEADLKVLDSNTSLMGQQVGRAANVLTASLLGDRNAVNAYMPQGLGSAIGTYLGDRLAQHVNTQGAPATPATPANNGQPVRELFGGAAIMTGRREREFDFLGGLLDAGQAIGGAGAAVGSGVTNAVGAVGNFFNNTAQRFGNFVTGDGFNTNSQVVARGILQLPEDQRYQATLFAANNGMLDLADLPYTIAPVASAVDFEDKLKHTEVQLSKGANAEKIIRALAKTHNTTDGNAEALLLITNGIEPDDPDGIKKLQAMIASGKKIQFDKDMAWISGVTQKEYTALGQVARPAQAAANQGQRFYWQTIAGKRANGQPTGDIRQAFWNWLKGGGSTADSGNVIAPTTGFKPGVVFINQASPNYDDGDPHPGNGIDIKAARTDKILLPEDGTFVDSFIGQKGVSGASYVDFQTQSGYLLRFKHTNNAFEYRKGMPLSAGSEVGKLDDTGNWNGWHLHFEVREASTKKSVDPVEYLHRVQPSLKFETSKRAAVAYQEYNQSAWNIIQANRYKK